MLCMYIAQHSARQLISIQVLSVCFLPLPLPFLCLLNFCFTSQCCTDPCLKSHNNVIWLWERRIKGERKITKGERSAISLMWGNHFAKECSSLLIYTLLLISLTSTLILSWHRLLFSWKWLFIAHQTKSCYVPDPTHTYSLPRPSSHPLGQVRYLTVLPHPLLFSVHLWSTWNALSYLYPFSVKTLPIFPYLLPWPLSYIILPRTLVSPHHFLCKPHEIFDYRFLFFKSL